MTAPRDRRISTAEGGFTLVEALVALAIGSLVVTLTLSSLRAAGTMLAGLKTRAAATEAIARAETILSGDTLHARMIRDAQGTLFFSGTEAEAVFAQAARPTAPWRGLSAVRLSLAQDSTGEVTLQRTEAPLGPMDCGDRTAPVTLWHSRDIVGLRYLDATGRWRPDWGDDTLPRALGVALGNGAEVPVLVAEFPDLVEPGCAEARPAPCRLRPGVTP